MAMQATHVRFALEFEGDLKIKDRSKYLSGVLYPDSRYVTGVKRSKTHDYSVQIKDLLSGSDFEKGCKIHVIYDKLQRVYLWGIFNIVSVKCRDSKEWYQITAGKLIEDIESRKIFADEIEIMESIFSSEKFHDESLEDMQNWYSLQQGVYRERKIEIESYDKIFKSFDEKVASEWIKTYKELDQDSDVKKQILEIYKKVVKEVHEGL